MKEDGFKLSDTRIFEECRARLNEDEAEIAKMVDDGASAEEVSILARALLRDWYDDLVDYKCRVSRLGCGRHRNWDQIRAIRAKRAAGMSIRAIAAALKCSTATVVQYCRCDDQGNYTILPDVLPR